MGRGQSKCGADEAKLFRMEPMGARPLGSSFSLGPVCLLKARRVWVGIEQDQLGLG